MDTVLRLKMIIKESVLQLIRLALSRSWLLTLCLVLVLLKAETTDSTCRLGFCFDPPKQRQLQTAGMDSTFLATVPAPMEVF